MTMCFRMRLLTLTIVAISVPATVRAQTAAARGDDPPALFADENLTAWLVMFTDPVKRTPDERAEMVAGLGFKKVGFEAFDRYVPILEEQMEAYARHGVETTSVYVVIRTLTPSEEPHVKAILDVLERRQATPQIWAMFRRNAFDGIPEEERLSNMIVAFSDLAERVQKSGCKLALYNYGSWFGTVDVQLAILDGVRKRTGIEIGTVLNFHRGHQHMYNFPEVLRRMKPHLAAVNLNGMNKQDANYAGGNARILPLGSGDYELTMMRQLVESGYRGPIGIIDHRSGVGAETALRENLVGLNELRQHLP